MTPSGHGDDKTIGDPNLPSTDVTDRPVGSETTKNNPIAAEMGRTLIDQLASALTREGLTVMIGRDATVEARQPAVAGSTVIGKALCPGLRQTMALRVHESALWWCWVWSGPTRDAPPELEPLCPATEIENAAEQISTVLAVETKVS